MGSSFGTLFRVTTWGESHGPGVGVVVDGCPPGLPLDEAMIQAEVTSRNASRRRKRKSAGWRKNHSERIPAAPAIAAETRNARVPPPSTK